MKLENKIINELVLSFENLTHYSLSVRNKHLPVKIKFLNLFRNLKINLFTSNNIKRPNRHNFSEFLENLNSRNLYVICGGEKGRKRFMSENIYFSFETNEDCTIKMYITFGNEPFYIPNNLEKKCYDKTTINNGNKSLSLKFLSDVRYFHISEDQIENLFKPKSASNSKYDSNQNSERIHSKDYKAINSDIKTSYLNFLSNRRRNFKKLEGNIKIINERKNTILENKMILQTLKMNKWKLIKLKV